MYTKYFVTGATGFLGRAVAGLLLTKDTDIYVLVMKDDPLAADLPDDIHIRVGNVCDPSSLDSFLEGADGQSCVIHCAGIVSVASRPGEQIYNVNVGGTKNIIDACISHGVGKLVYVSSVHALAEKPKGVEIDAETDTFDPKRLVGDYAKSKAMATHAVLDAAKTSLDASVVLPSGIIGPGDTAGGSITELLRSFLAGKLPIAVRGGYDFVDVRDAAAGIVSCAEKGVRGKCYILSGHYATIRDILETVGRSTGINKAVSYLPVALAKIIAPFYEIDSIRRKKKLFFTPYAVHVLQSNALFSGKAAAQDLGYAPRSLKETLIDTVKWLKKSRSAAL